jgi:hypothetical protein
MRVMCIKKMISSDVVFSSIKVGDWEDTNFYEFYSKVSIARIRQDKLNELGI